MKVSLGKLNQRLHPVVTQLKELDNYKAPPYLFTGLLQTAFTKSVLPPDPKPRIRESFTIPAYSKEKDITCCPDEIPEGIISIDWVYPQDKKKNKGIVVLIPGLTGSSADSYIVAIADALTDAGFIAVCFNPRAQGGNRLISPFLYSAGYTGDIRWLFQKLKTKFPKQVIYAMGFSLGSNYLAKYLGEEGDNSFLKGAMMVGGPLNCLKNSSYLQRNCITRLCDRKLASGVMKVFHEIESVLRQHPKLQLDGVAPKVKTMYDVDHYFTAPMMGYGSANDYYIGASCLPFISSIRTDSLFISARNDPIIDYLGETLEEFENNPYVLRALTATGGHSMSWPEAPFGKSSWLSKVAVQFFKEMSVSIKSSKEQVDTGLELNLS